MKVALIACCASKLDSAAPASQLYQSALFQKSRRYAERNCDQFAILSARYGLVLADQMIEPYDQTLNRMTADERRNWANGVLKQLVDWLPIYRMPVHLIFLAGANYRENLVEVLSDGNRDAVQCQVQICEPMKGMAIGKQLQWLVKQTF